jgi:hypothetical protein
MMKVSEALSSSVLPVVVEGEPSLVVEEVREVVVVAASSGVVSSVDGSPDPPANQKR